MKRDRASIKQLRPLDSRANSNMLSRPKSCVDCLGVMSSSHNTNLPLSALAGFTPARISETRRTINSSLGKHQKDSKQGMEGKLQIKS